MQHTLILMETTRLKYNLVIYQPSMTLRCPNGQYYSERIPTLSKYWISCYYVLSSEEHTCEECEWWAHVSNTWHQQPTRWLGLMDSNPKPITSYTFDSIGGMSERKALEWVVACQYYNYRSGSTFCIQNSIMEMIQVTEGWREEYWEIRSEGWRRSWPIAMELLAAASFYFLPALPADPHTSQFGQTPQACT